MIKSDFVLEEDGDKMLVTIMHRDLPIDQKVYVSILKGDGQSSTVKFNFDEFKDFVDKIWSAT